MKLVSHAVTQLQHIPLDLGSPVVSCSVADPHVVLLSAVGQVLLLTLIKDTSGEGGAGKVRLSVHRPQLHQVRPETVAS